MGSEITMSSKGQIVIPKDVRDALGIAAGEKFSLSRVGSRIVLELADDEGRQKISYEEFRRRVPAYDGPRVAVEDMTAPIARLFGTRGDRSA